MSSTSSIRVYVQWLEPTVFAGEDVGCQITFKNIAAVPGTPRIPSNTSTDSGSVSLAERHRKPLIPSQVTDARGSPSNVSISRSSRSLPPNRGHRSTLSLNVPASARFQRADAQSINDAASETGSKGRGHSHRRSVSIISLGPSEMAPSEVSGTTVNESPRIPFRRHGRAASLQIAPRRANPNGNGPPSGILISLRLFKAHLLTL